MTKRKKNADVSELPYNVDETILYEDPDKNGEYVRLVNYGNHEGWYIVNQATGSDYSGGLVVKSNYEALQEILDEEHPSASKPVVWALFSGGYATYGIVVKWNDLDEEAQEAIGGLDEYPLLSDDKYNELMLEAEEEAWENWVQRDFEDALEKHYDLDEFPESVDSYDIWRAAMNEANEYWEDTSEGIYIRIDNVVPSAVEIIDADTALSKKFSERAANPRRATKAARALKAKLLR